MKSKYFKYLVFVMILLVLQPVSVLASGKLPKATEAFYVNDFANVIDEKVEEKIINYGNQLSDKLGAQVVLVTVDFTDGIPIDTYAMDIFNEWGIGSKEKNNGLLLLLSIGDDDYWALQGEGLEDTLSSGLISDILWENLEADFAVKDYSTGAEKAYGAFIQTLGGQWGEDGTEEVREDIQSDFIIDHARILNSKVIEDINNKSMDTLNTYGAGFYVVTKDHSGNESFQEDAIGLFEEMKLSSKDVLLILYKEDDNYWVLPGDEAEKFLSEDVLRDILDNDLEPSFAKSDYSKGALNTANRVYTLFNQKYKKMAVTESAKNSNTNYSNSESKHRESSQNSGESVIGFLFMFLIVLWFFSSRRKKRYRRMYGIPFNPYTRSRVRTYGPGGYWGHYGPPPAGGGYWYNGCWNTAPRHRHTPPRYNNYSNERPTSSGGSYWGGNGGSSKDNSSSTHSFWGSGGGAGRSTSSGSSRNSSSGGASRGGGAGRSSSSSWSSSSSKSFSSSRSSSSGAGRSSSGSGGSSRGGGAGRGSR